LKLETLKMIGTPRKINTILLIIKINRPKLIAVCVDINWQYTDKISWKYT